LASLGPQFDDIISQYITQLLLGYFESFMTSCNRFPVILPINKQTNLQTYASKNNTSATVPLGKIFTPNHLLTPLCTMRDMQQ